MNKNLIFILVAIIFFAGLTGADNLDNTSITFLKSYSLTQPDIDARGIFTNDSYTFWITDAYNRGIWLLNNSFSNTTSLIDTSSENLNDPQKIYFNGSRFWITDISSNPDILYILNKTYKNISVADTIYGDGFTGNKSALFASQLSYPGKIMRLSPSGINNKNITCSVYDDCDFIRALTTVNGTDFWLLEGNSNPRIVKINNSGYTLATRKLNHLFSSTTSSYDLTTFDGNSFWILNASNDQVIKVYFYSPITIKLPQDNQEIIDTLNTTLNVSTLSEYNSAIWYSFSGGIVNRSLCTNSNECQSNITFPRQGYYNITVYANDSENNIASTAASNLFVGNSTIYDFNYPYNGTKSFATDLVNNRAITNRSELNKSDGIPYCSGGSDTYSYREHLFYYNLTNLSIESMTFLYSGYGQYAPQSNMNLLLYNQSNNQWIILESLTDFTINRNYSYKRTDLKDIINSTNYTNFKASFYSNWDSGYALCSDYAGLNVSYYSPNIAPIIYPTITNNSNFSAGTLSFTFNISDDFEYLKNISLFLDGNRNTTSFYNQVITPVLNNSFNFSLNSISDGIHTWFIQAYDSDGAQSNSTTFTFTIDSTPPNISFINPSDNSGSYINRSYIHINISAIDAYTGLKNLTIYLYNITTQINSSNSTQSPFYAVFSNLSDKIYFFNVTAYDNSGNYNSTITRNVTIDTLKPSIQYSNPTESDLAIKKQNFIIVNISFTEINFANISFILSNTTSIVNQTNYLSNITLINWSNLPNENYNYYVRITDLAGNYNQTSSRSIVLDTKFPQYQNISASPANANYSINQKYYFNLTWELPISTAGVEINGINYTMSTSGFGNYNLTISNLAADTYNYYFWANDSAGNMNVTPTYQYILNKKTPSCTISGNSPVNYPNGLNITASCDNPESTTKLYRDNVDITSLNSIYQNISAGTYTFKANITDTQNYSSATSESIQGTISKASGLIYVYLNNSRSDTNIISGQQIYLNATLVTGQGTIILYRNNAAINSGQSPLSNLTTFSSAGQFNITAIYAGNTNYTSSSETWFVFVSDSSPPVLTILFPTSTTYNYKPTNINYSVSSGSLDSCWYSLNQGITNSTPTTACQNFTGLLANEGTNIWTVYSNDTSGNLVQRSTTFSVDTIPPSISIKSPNNTNYVSRNLLINISSNSNSIWYSINGQPNLTYSSETYTNFSAGQNTIQAYSNDSSNNINTTTNSFYIDFNNMTALSLQSTPEFEFGANVTLQDIISTYNTNITSCSFTLKNSTTTIINNEIGIKDSEFIWNSTSQYFILNFDTYNYSSICTNEFGFTNETSHIKVVNYTLNYFPENYTFNAISDVSEQNNITIFMSDSVSSNVNYTISLAIQNQSEFTIVNPASILLDSSDSISNQYSFIISLNASTSIAEGVYYGNITLNNELNSQKTVIPFTYNINPPAGQPTLYSSFNQLCTSVSGSDCSIWNLQITQGNSQPFYYLIKNTGGYKLSNCNFVALDDFFSQSWISSSLSNTDLEVGESKLFSVVFSPTLSTSIKTYYGYLNVVCESSNIESDNGELVSPNRPFNKITITQGTSPTSPAGGGGASAPNASQITQGICGNRLCEANFNETYLSCPVDCTGNINPITSCFESPLLSNKECILVKKTSLIYVFLFMAFVVAFFLLFEIKSNEFGGPKSIRFSPIFSRRKKR